MKFSASGDWWGKDWYEKYALGAKYGFKGVECLGWLDVDVERAKNVIKDTGVTSTAVIMQSVCEDNMKKLEWSHGMVYEDTRSAFVESFRETVRFCKEIGVPNVIATTGNRRFDISNEAQFEICVKTLKEMSKIAENEGVMIVVEPLNILVNHKGYYLVTTEDAVKMIKAVDSTSCKICFDIYHQQISEGNVIRNITNNIEYIGHFHIADNPGRNQPGTGELNYTNIFRAIKETGYSRWLAFECGNTVGDRIAEDMHALIDPFSD